MIKLLFPAWLFTSFLACAGPPCHRPLRIVILGSSTAFGTGSKPIADSSWVNRYAAYLKTTNPRTRVINLAIGGYDTYRIQPDGFVQPAGRPRPDSLHNITRALALKPDAIIINLPSNDVAENITEQDQKDNFDRVAQLAAKAHVPLWVTTTQPRNLPPVEAEVQLDLRDWVKSRFGSRAIDFWTGLSSPENTQDTLYGAGDGIHLNNAGHRILFQRVVDMHIPDTLCAIREKNHH